MPPMVAPSPPLAHSTSPTRPSRQQCHRRPGLRRPRLALTPSRLRLNPQDAARLRRALRLALYAKPHIAAPQATNHVKLLHLSATFRAIRAARGRTSAEIRTAKRLHLIAATVRYAEQTRKIVLPRNLCQVLVEKQGPISGKSTIIGGRNEQAKRSHDCLLFIQPFDLVFYIYLLPAIPCKTKRKSTLELFDHRLPCICLHLRSKIQQPLIAQQKNRARRDALGYLSFDR